MILELAWVLKINGCSREEIAKGLRALIGLSNFIPEQFQAVLYALRWFESGMDFADSLHLALSNAQETLMTFDRDFAQAAKRAQAFPEVKMVRNLAGMATKTDK